MINGNLVSYFRVASWGLSVETRRMRGSPSYGWFATPVAAVRAAIRDRRESIKIQESEVKKLSRKLKRLEKGEKK